MNASLIISYGKVESVICKRSSKALEQVHFKFDMSTQTTNKHNWYFTIYYYFETVNASFCFILAYLHVDMMTSSNGNVFRVTGHLCWECTGPR